MWPLGIDCSLMAHNQSMHTPMRQGENGFSGVKSSIIGTVHYFIMSLSVALVLPTTYHLTSYLKFTSAIIHSEA